MKHVLLEMEYVQFVRMRAYWRDEKKLDGTTVFSDEDLAGEKGMIVGGFEGRSSCERRMGDVRPLEYGR